MEVLWAPWRMAYILGKEPMDSCIFCPGNDRSKDKERLILYTDNHVVVLMNKYPYVNGHLLVAPFRHVPDFEGLVDHELLHLTRMVRTAISILKEHMKPDGFNIGVNLGKVAGAGVEQHLHYHIVPRWHGDTNFMTVLGDVRVIPEHIEATYDKLVGYFKNLKGG